MNEQFSFLMGKVGVEKFLTRQVFPPSIEFLLKSRRLFGMHLIEFPIKDNTDEREKRQKNSICRKIFSPTACIMSKSSLIIQLIGCIFKKIAGKNEAKQMQL